MSATDFSLVLVTAPDEEAAARIARALVEARLAACGNVLPGARSIYRWQGAVEEAKEALLLLKVPTARFEEVAARVAELHPYECPEVLRVGLDGGLPAYLAWLADSTDAL